MYNRRMSTNSVGEYRPSRSVLRELEEEGDLYDDFLEPELERGKLSQEQRARKHSVVSNAFSGRLARDMSLQTLNAPYAKKWRVLLAILLGVSLIGVCILGFYVTVEVRKSNQLKSNEVGTEATILKPRNETSTSTSRSKQLNIKWRTENKICLSLVNSTCPKDYEAPPVLVVAVDGLRPDMLSADVAPAMSYLRECGVTAKSLVPVYPTSTLPNLYSVATGLYPESHGIIGNRMYDPETNQNFTLSKTNSPQWWGGEPIWKTVKKQGKRAIAYYWAGAEDLIHENRSAHWKQYKSEGADEVRVKEVLQWLTSPAKEVPHLTMVYTEKPMTAIAEFGIDSEEAREAISLIDKEIDVLMAGLYEKGVINCVNILILSDHGASRASKSSSFFLESILEDIASKAQIFTGPVARVRAREGGQSTEYLLDNLRCKNAKVRALSKDLLPVRYHYANNPRIEKIILDAKPHTRLVLSSNNYQKKAEHGFNNLECSMQATFIGFGPNLKVNFVSHSFRNIELYNMMCHLVGVTPSANNGTQGSLNHLLRDSSPPSSTTFKLLEEETHPPPEGVVRSDPKEDRVCVCDAKDEPEVEEIPTTTPIPEATTTQDSTPFTTTTTTTSPNTTQSANETTAIPPPIPNNSTGNETANSTTTTTTTSTTTPTTIATTTTTTTTTTATTTTTTTPSPEVVKARLAHLFRSHVPWGSLGYSSVDGIEGKLKILLHNNYVIGLHEALNLSSWVSFSFNKTILDAKSSIPEGIETKPEDLRTEERPPPCWRADPRLSRSLTDQCHGMLNTDLHQEKDISLVQLFPEELETQEMTEAHGHLLSNMAPVRKGYNEGARDVIVKAIKSWAEVRFDLNVILGPVFDYDTDGRQDSITHTLNLVTPPVPSSYFYIISSCTQNKTVTDCLPEDLDVLAFVFPNSDVLDNCLMKDYDYLHYHMANVRDVELLTGLRFFKEMDDSKAILLRTKQPYDIWSLTNSSSQLCPRIGESEVGPLPLKAS